MNFVCYALLIPCYSHLNHGHINLPYYSRDSQSCENNLDKKLPITGIGIWHPDLLKGEKVSALRTICHLKSATFLVLVKSNGLNLNFSILNLNLI